MPAPIKKRKRKKRKLRPAIVKLIKEARLAAKKKGYYLS